MKTNAQRDITQFNGTFGAFSQYLDAARDGGQPITEAQVAELRGRFRDLSALFARVAVGSDTTTVADAASRLSDCAQAIQWEACR